MMNLTPTTLCPKCKHMVKPVRKIGLRQLVLGLLHGFNQSSYYSGESAKSCPLCGYDDVYDEGLNLIQQKSSK